jgi:hypothetical protein
MYYNQLNYHLNVIYHTLHLIIKKGFKKFKKPTHTPINVLIF